MQGAPHRLVAALEERFRVLETDFHRAYWESQVAASPATDRRRADTELELRRAKGDAGALRSVGEALEDTHDPPARRQLEVLRLSLAGNQMSDAQRERIVELSTSIESDFASYRPEFEGRALTAQDVDDLLESSDDSRERERVWTASKEIGSVVASRVRELARVRNEVARDQGFPDYFTMALDLQEIPEEWLFGVLERLDELTSAPFARWKRRLDEGLRRRFGVDELSPWHYADPFFQRLPRAASASLDQLLGDARADELARGTFALWNVDLAGVMDRSDLFPRAAKSEHAFCLDVDRTGADVRILANVVPGERWLEVMLHESGHAAYDVTIDPDLPYLLHRPAHTFVTEAIAILSAGLMRDRRWMIEVAGLPAADVDVLAPEQARVNGSLMFARWGLVVVHFERALYADPEGELDGRWWELVERFQHVAAPRDRAVPDWAAKVHVSTTPVYYHNYLLGELLAAQLREQCRRSFGTIVGESRAGELLFGRLARAGALLRWDALVEEVTGRPLSPDGFSAAVRSAEATVSPTP